MNCCRGRPATTSLVPLCTLATPREASTLMATGCHHQRFVIVRLATRRKVQAHSIHRRAPGRFGCQFHMVRTTELFLNEINFPLLFQFLAVPAIELEELLVIRPFLVPVGEQAAGDVYTLAIPALTDHIDLLAGRFFVYLLR